MNTLMKSRVVAPGLAAACMAFAGGALAQATNSAATNSGRPAERPLSAGAPNIVAPYGQAIALVQGASLVSAKGFNAFSHPVVGIYCFELPGYVNATTEPVVSVEWGASLGVALYAQYNRANSSCPAPTTKTIEVRTYKGDTGGVGSALQTPELSDSVAFVIMVP